MIFQKFFPNIIFRTNIAIITARGGSKRIPRKNIKEFMGKPMIAYAIEASISSEIFDEVMVSTDDMEIAEIAKKYGLPQVVIDFIQQHHGESLAGNFYNKAVEQEGEENVQEWQFRYPGPKPKTKETAILMIADAVESAVRSLKSPTTEEIDAMIDKIIIERLNDTQLSDSPLTLKDIKT